MEGPGGPLRSPAGFRGTAGAGCAPGARGGPNPASEHHRMEKLLVDPAVTWAKQYKVDGFRFDLMGHHMKRNMLALRQALDALTFKQDRVDGSKVYLYGEGWNFGEVANGARGENAIQRNMAGTGIGTFNDRLRDGARGGGPLGGGAGGAEVPRPQQLHLGGLVQPARRDSSEQQLGSGPAARPRQPVELAADSAAAG